MVSPGNVRVVDSQSTACERWISEPTVPEEKNVNKVVELCSLS